MSGSLNKPFEEQLFVVRLIGRLIMISGFKDRLFGLSPSRREAIKGTTAAVGAAAIGGLTLCPAASGGRHSY